MHRLMDICVIDWGNTSLTKKAYEANGKYLAVSATGADGRISFYEHEDDVCVLSAIGAQCGKIFFPQRRFTAIKNTITLTPKRDVVESKYLYYLFTYIELPKRGSAQPFISKGDIEKFELPFLPPLAEQQRIVEKLDRAFAEIDNLAQIVDEECDSLNELYRTYVSNLISGQTESSALRTVGDLISELITGPFGSSLHKADYIEDGVAVINPQNIVLGNLDVVASKKISGEKARSLSRYLVKKNDILIGRRGEMGRCALVTDLTNPIFCGTGCMIVRAKPDTDINFLFELLSSHYVKDRLERSSVGATMANLNQNILLNIPVNVRSRREQTASAELIKRYREAITQTKSIFNQKSIVLGSLKSSILKQALQPPQQ